jgi:hypothetical protein
MTSDRQTPRTLSVRRASPASLRYGDRCGDLQRGLQRGLHTRAPLTVTQPFKLDTSLPARKRSDSDEAPPSVIHVPADFKQFVRNLFVKVALPRR